MSIEICSCVDLVRCCVCDVELRDADPVELQDIGGTVHVYCQPCASAVRDDDEDEED